MPTYSKKNPKDLVDVANRLMAQYYSDLQKHEVKIDFLFAYPRYDANDNPVGDAIKHHGVKALGLAKILGLKERSKGNGDAEILIDWPWWETASEKEREALVSHELHHLALKVNKNGIVLKDDLDRPKLQMRPHDFQIGWFATIAHRHGIHSQERIQAAQMMEAAGQYFWPEIANANKGSRIAHLEQHTKTVAQPPPAA